nr:uncharacterized protein LOC123840941 [Mirounga angustirostris]
MVTSFAVNKGALWGNPGGPGLAGSWARDTGLSQVCRRGSRGPGGLFELLWGRWIEGTPKSHLQVPERRSQPRAPWKWSGRGGGGSWIGRFHPEEQPIGSVAPACVGLAFPGGGRGLMGAQPGTSLSGFIPITNSQEAIFLSHFADGKLRLRASDSQGQATELAGVVKSSNSEAWWYWILASPCAGDPTLDLASVKGLHAWTGPGAGPPGQLDGGWTRIHTDLVFCPLPAARSSSHAALAGWGGSRHSLVLTRSPRSTPLGAKSPGTSMLAALLHGQPSQHVRIKTSVCKAPPVPTPDLPMPVPSQ